MCLNNGLSYESLMRMDMNEVESFMEGVIEKKESSLNDQLALQHQLGILINKAMWDGENYPKEPHKVSFATSSTDSPSEPTSYKAVSREKTREEVLEEIWAYQRKMHDEERRLGLV